MDWEQLGLQALAYVLPIAATVLSALASWALIAIRKKTGIDIDIRQDAALRVAIRSAIAGAEEWAARKLKLEDKKVDANEKADWVWNIITKTWPKLEKSEFDGLLDQELAMAAGVGATGKAIGEN